MSNSGDYMKNQWLTIRQLDKHLKEWQSLSNQSGTPKAGWIKTLRVALNMSAAQFANRLGLSRARINQLENAEAHHAVTLRTLSEAADALGCELVYAIVPKHNSSLEEIIKTRAEQLANDRVARVAHTMSLESQSVDSSGLKHQKDELVKQLTEHLNKKFWETETPKQHTNLQQKLINHLKKKK